MNKSNRNQQVIKAHFTKPYMQLAANSINSCFSIDLVMARVGELIARSGVFSGVAR
jgi:hypothetical protein